METADDLAVPNGAEEEARAPPAIASLANVIAALAGSEGLVSPKRFEVAVTAAQGVGNLLGEPSLTRVLTFRALAAPQDPRAAIATLKRHTPALPPPDRAAVMRALAELIGDDAKPSVAGLAPDLAAALGVPLPDHLRRTGGGIRDGLAHLTERAMRLVRHEAPLIAASRDFATTFGEPGLLTAVEDAERVGDNRLLNDALRSTLENVRERVGAIIQAAETQSEALQIAQELERAAEEIERVARQRYAAITRRAKMLKRHLREDLHALAENAAEEFEVDFWRLAETKGWFGRLETSDLDDRVVVKNLERRYQQLARRYQDQLDLFEREVSEFCEEFTRVSEEVLRPLARHEFRSVIPHPGLELRMKAAVDRATSRTLIAGAAGAFASGAAVQSGMVTAAAVVGVAVTPVGIAILGTLAAAGVWKVFATPRERHRRDLRERSRDLEEGLRKEILTNLPQFEHAVDVVVSRFRLAAIPEITGPRVEAERIREIADAHRSVAQSVAKAANLRIDRLLPLLPDDFGTPQSREL